MTNSRVTLGRKAWHYPEMVSEIIKIADYSHVKETNGNFENSMNKEKLVLLEQEINAELKRMCQAEGSIHRPITDGVVDEYCYLASSPRILWILKEPWEDYDEKGGGGWSVTKDLIPEQLAYNTIPNGSAYAKMAYIAHSVHNGYKPWAEIRYVKEDIGVREALRRIAYINVSKLPGGRTSDPNQIAKYYEQNRRVLKRQIETIAPDVVIGGSTLPLFFSDLNLREEDFTEEGSVTYCVKEGRVYVNAFHPSYWCIKAETYVNDIVSAIEKGYQETRMSKAAAA